MRAAGDTPSQLSSHSSNQKSAESQQHPLFLTDSLSGNKSVSRLGKGCWMPARTRASQSEPSRYPGIETGVCEQAPSTPSTGILQKGAQEPTRLCPQEDSAEGKGNTH